MTLVALLSFSFQFVIIQAASASTFEVVNTNYSGAGSFTQAITDANANPGRDTITFNIPGTGPHIFNSMPGQINITSPVTIDGLSQPGSECRGNLNIVFDYDNTWNKSIQFLSGAIGSTVQGVVMNSKNSNFINIINADDMVFRCNYFEMTSDGQTRLESYNNHVAIALQAGKNFTLGGSSFEDGNVLGETVSTGGGGGTGEGLTIQNNTFGFNADETQFLGKTPVLNNYFPAPLKDITIKDNVFQGAWLSNLDDLKMYGNTNCMDRDHTVNVCPGNNGEIILGATNNFRIGGALPEQRNHFAGGNNDWGLLRSYGASDTNMLIENNYFNVINDQFNNSGPLITGSALNIVGENIEIKNNVSVGYDNTFVTSGSNISIHGNSIYHPAYKGITATNIAGSLNVKNNMVSSFGLNGIQIVATVDTRNIAVEENEISGNAGTGIYLTGNGDRDLTGSTISNNTVTGTASGLWAEPFQYSNLVISNNNFTGSGLSDYGRGIYVNSNAYIHDNTVNNFKLYGVLANSNSSILRNQISNIGAVGIQSVEGSIVLDNTFENIGERAIYMTQLGEWSYSQSEFYPPIIRKVKVVGNSTEITYDFDAEPGKYRVDLCNSSTGNLPEYGGTCENKIASETRTIENNDNGIPRYIMTISQTGFNRNNLSLQAHMVNESDPLNYTNSSTISKPNLLRPGLQLIIGNEDINTIVPGQFSGNEFYLKLCNSTGEAVQSATLQLTSQNISNLKLNLNQAFSDAHTLGSYNAQTKTWTGEIYDGDCLYFDISGTAANTLGAKASIDANIVTAVTDGETVGVDGYVERSYSHEKMINLLPDLAIFATLKTTGNIKAGDTVNYDVDVANIGDGMLGSNNDSYVGIYFIVPDGATFLDVADLDTNDSLNFSGCEVQGNIHDMGPQFSAYYGDLVACSLESTTGLQPKSHHLFRFTMTAGNSFAQGTAQVLGVAFADDPDTILFMNTFETGEDGFALEINNIFRLSYDPGELTVTINRCEGYTGVIEINDACFTVVFNKPIWAPSFVLDDLILEGEGQIYSFTQNTDTQWTVRINGMVLGQTLRLTLDPESVQDLSAVLNGTYVLGENTIRFGSLTSDKSSAVSETNPVQSNGNLTSKSSSGLLANTGSETFPNVISALSLIFVGLFLYKRKQSRSPRY